MSHLALHVCCAPCMILPLEHLKERFERITVVYANSNIHPEAEYIRRRDFARTFALQLGAEFVEVEYNPLKWMHAVADKKPRCVGCYELRLGEVAKWAAENGADVVSTVLTISPYQDHEAIADCGRAACKARGLVYLDESFVALYPQSINRSKAEHIYRQNYCGCAPSLQESLVQQEQRAQRKAALQKEKEQRCAQALINKQMKQKKKEHDRAH